jgi:hypothetical protein
VLTLDEVPEGDAFGVSATLFVTYLRCPQQALARLQGVYGRPSRASFKGALTHRIIARHIDRGAIDPAEFAMVCRQETGAKLNAQLADVGLRPSEFGAVVEEVSELYKRFAALSLDGLEASEMSFEDTVAEGVTLRGRIDAVFDGPEGTRIVDWKTGAHLGDDVAAQLGFYALAWSKRNGVPPAVTEAMSLATGEKLVHEPTVDDIAQLEHDVASMIGVLRVAMRDGRELDRTAGPHCRWCPLLDSCSEGAAAIEILD